MSSNNKTNDARFNEICGELADVLDKHEMSPVEGLAALSMTMCTMAVSMQIPAGNLLAGFYGSAKIAYGPKFNSAPSNQTPPTIN